MPVDAGPTETATLVSAGLLGVSCIVSAWLCARAMRAGHGTPMFIRRLVLALAMVAVGAVWAVLDRVAPLVGYHGHDLVFLAAAFVVAVGMVRHPDLGPGPRRARYIVDAVIAGLSLSALVWLIATHSTALQAIPQVRQGAVITATAIAFAITRTGIAITLHRPKGSVEESATAMMAVAFGVCTLGGLLHLLADTSAPSPIQVTAGFGVLALGAALFGVSAIMVLKAQEPWFRVPRRRMHSMFDVIPVTVAVFATGALLADAAAQGSFDRTAAVLLTVVVSSVLLRQSWTLSDNRTLATSLRRTVDDLERQATHDPLTGLPNRGGLDQRIDTAVASACERGYWCLVGFVDIDHLKVINDTLGHRAGDELIRHAATRLAGEFGDAVTRFGGDEFVLVSEIRDMTPEEIGRRIVALLSEPIEIDGQRVQPSCSVGLAVAGATVSAGELLRRADVALYQAKGLGRDCAAVHRPELDTGLMADLDLGPELRRAIEHDEFTLHYQPIVDLVTGRTEKVEALLRWAHPERGVLGPEVFLEEAVSAGLLGAIGELSLRRACRDISELLTALGPGLPTVSVNLSSSELTDRRAVNRVRTALELARVEPQWLNVEITEDVIVDDTVQEVIAEIRELGVGLAVDDFGTGNSSLRQLGSYRADILKIDRSFVERITCDHRANAITRSIVGMALDLGLEPVAEGVEDASQARELSAMGCRFGQGWHFARPMPFDEVLVRCVEEASADYDSRASVESASSMMRPSSSATVGRSAMAPTT